MKKAVDCCTAVVVEAIVVAAAAGITLTVGNPKEIVDKAVEGLLFDFKTSIPQDIENGCLAGIGGKDFMAVGKNRQKGMNYEK